jgi:Cu-processing system permease protein
MFKVFKYSFYDMVKNRWMFIYFAFYLLITSALLLLNSDFANIIISLTNIVLVLTPLIGLMFGTMYYYNSLDFIKLLLAQPLSRQSILIGIYSGLAVSLCVSMIAGIGIPLLIKGIMFSPYLPLFGLLLFAACVLTVIFTLLAFIISVKNDNKIIGFGIALFLWLFLAIIYDGIFLLLLLIFKEYPLEQATIFLTTLNPIDLSRIMILLKLDISAMMGYTGAVLQKFLGSNLGFLFISGSLFIWILLPFLYLKRIVKRKDF